MNTKRLDQQLDVCLRQHMDSGSKADWQTTRHWLQENGFFEWPRVVFGTYEEYAS